MSQTLIDDAIWARLEPLLPTRRLKRGHGHGRTPIPDRAILTGILFVLRSGIPWQMLPRQMGCGSGSTCWRRLVRWQRTGVWQRLHETLLAELRRRGRLDQRWTVIDSGSVRAVRGGKKLDRTQPIAARRAPSTTSSPMRVASHSSRSFVHANIARSFGLGGRRSFQFRMDVQNLFNRQPYANPVLDPTSTNFGQVRAVTQEVMRFFTFNATFRF